MNNKKLLTNLMFYDTIYNEKYVKNCVHNQYTNYKFKYDTIESLGD